MSALYKAFTQAGPVFFGALALACLVCAPPAGAQEMAVSAYTVEHVEVDVTAANAVKAREEALIRAQVKAFEALADAQLSEEARASYAVPDADTIMGLVKDFEVTNEQLSATRYKGIFTVRFRPALAQRYLHPLPAETAEAFSSGEEYGYRGQDSDRTAAPAPVYEAPAADSYRPAPVHSAYRTPVTIRARFASVQEWVRLKQALERHHAVTVRRIVALRPTEALVELGFNGDAGALQQALLGAGLSVSPAQSIALDTQAPLFDVGFGGYARY